MHEMALCRNVVDMVLEEADKVGAQRVSGVYLTVGYSRDIVEPFRRCIQMAQPRYEARGREPVHHARPLHGQVPGMRLHLSR